MEYIKVGKSHGIIGFLESITGITGTSNHRDSPRDSIHAISHELLSSAGKPRHIALGCGNV